MTVPTPHTDTSAAALNMALMTPALPEADLVPKGDLEYWYALIPERTAGEFLALVPRTMQAMRQRGDGPKYVRLSARCVRYTRFNLKKYADARLRSNTSEDSAA